MTLDAAETISARELVLTLSGQESTQVEYTKSEGDGENHRTVRRTDTGYRSFLSVQLPVESFSVIQSGKVMPGQHDIPFDIELPDHIPSSAFFEHGSSNFRIMYDVKVHLRGSGKLWDYKESKPIQVRGKSLAREPMPYSSQPVKEAVNLCCINKGSIVFGAKILDTRLDLGETCTLHLSLRNNSTVAVEKVGAHMFQTCWWVGGSHHSTSSRRDLGTFTFPNMPGTEAQSGDGERDIEFNQLKNVFEEIESGLHAGQITMPENAIPSYKGNLVKISHQLVVFVDVGSCVSSPEINVPILCGEKSTTKHADSENSQGHTAGVVVVPSSSVNFGGLPTESDDPDIVFSMLQEPGKPSIETLLKEMEASMADLQLIETKLKDPDWIVVFRGLTTDAIPKIVKQIDMDFDQPTIMKQIAELMDSFSCEHAVAAVRATKQWNRGAMVEALLPHCRDLAANNTVIKNELTDWENIITQAAFDEALG